MSGSSTWLSADHALPHRDELLNPDIMRERFSRVLVHSHRVVDACERVRVNYQLGKSLRALYRVRVNGTQTLVASRMFREGRSAAAFAATAAMAPVDSGFRAVAHDAALDAVYWSFPNDRKINSLPLVAAPTPEITRLVPDGWATSEIVAYAPEKTATAACLSGAGRI